MGKSWDTIARNVLLAGTNVLYANGTAGTDAGPRNTIATTDRLNSTAIRQAVALMRNNSVPGYQRNGQGNAYMAFTSPDSSVDLRSETGAAAWRDPHVYSQPGEIWNGEIGKYEDVIFVETERLWMNNSNPAEYPAGFQNGGAGGTVDVYATLFCGAQALAKAYSSTVSAPQPEIVIGNIIDILKRFVPIGWYWLGGFAIFRQASVVRLEHSSSVGT
jgi:N4-gp56 family major capsid protein